jgi:hypothetical protein
MASQLSRIEIVRQAVALAGRGSEMYPTARTLLNTILRSLALRAKHPALRKTGTEITLAAGSTTVELPSDFGAGSDHLIFGSDRKPIFELGSDEFVDRGGFPSNSAGNGRPTAYIVDLNAGVYRFNVAADQAYGFIPIYFCVPEAIDEDSNGDTEKPWYRNDETLVEGLLWRLYTYLQDVREDTQKAKFEQAVAADLRGSVPMNGGVSRIRLNPARFR